MKAIKKILLFVSGLFVIGIIGSYFYFDYKFTPEKNYLTVEHESGNIPIKWPDVNRSALLLPVHFLKDSTTYYLQFDTGAVYTEFYSPAIDHLKGVSLQNGCAVSSFYIGKTKISSDKIKITNTGKGFSPHDSVKIIGTLGADILEGRKTLINFKNNFIVLNLSRKPKESRNPLMNFTFKKRKIIINGYLIGKREKFLYDSGTSAYELLTNKENWEELKQSHAKIVVEKAQSRPNILTSYTASTNKFIQFSNKKVQLTEVTYVEGFSQTQYMLMKFSGMTGMLGNKVFLKNIIYIDCPGEKIGIE